MPPEFDWSLGVDTDGVDDNEKTPQSERGAQVATSNALNMDKADAPWSEKVEDNADAEANRDAEQKLGDAAGSGEQQADAGDAGEDGGHGGDDGLILGKFKTPDDLAKAYQELEQFKGQQGSEVGQLRDQIKQMEGYLASVQAQMSDTSNQPISDDLVSQVDDLAMDNPQGAATWALQHQPLLYNRVMQIWAQNDALGASRFENGLMRDQLKQEMEERIKEQYGPVAETVSKNTQAAEFDAAWRSVSSRLPDFGQYESSLIDAAATAPELASALQSGDANAKERLIENLYWLAKGRQADTVAQAATDLGRTQQQANTAAKMAAGVASGSSAQARGEKTNVENWKDQFLAAPSTSIVDGFTNGPPKR